MHKSRALVLPLSFLIAAACAGVAMAQTADEGVTIVNPNVAGSGGVLLYPGGQYGRVSQPLLQPGDPFPGTEKPIKLHLPPRHLVQRARPKPPTAVASVGAPATTAAPAAAPDTTMPGSATGPTAELQQAAPPPPPAPKHIHVAKAAAPAKVTAAPTPDAGGARGDAAIPLSLFSGPQPDTTPAAPPPPPTRVAKANPPPAQTSRPAHNAEGTLAPGVTKQSQILFAPGVADPTADATEAIKGLATPLNNALAAGASSVELVAYGGARGDKSSEARRLSLKRALIIRQLLIDGGVPAEHIVVRALGGTSDNDATDRVDVFTKT